MDTQDLAKLHREKKRVPEPKEFTEGSLSKAVSVVFRISKYEEQKALTTEKFWRWEKHEYEEESESEGRKILWEWMVECVKGKTQTDHLFLSRILFKKQTSSTSHISTDSSKTFSTENLTTFCAKVKTYMCMECIEGEDICLSRPHEQKH